MKKKSELIAIAGVSWIEVFDWQKASTKEQLCSHQTSITDLLNGKIQSESKINNLNDENGQPAKIFQVFFEKRADNDNKNYQLPCVVFSSELRLQYPWLFLVNLPTLYVFNLEAKTAHQSIFSSPPSRCLGYRLDKHKLMIARTNEISIYDMKQLKTQDWDDVVTIPIPIQRIKPPFEISSVDFQSQNIFGIDRGKGSLHLWSNCGENLLSKRITSNSQ